MNEQDIQSIVEENARLREELQRLYGVDRPFICGTAGPVDEADGMPTHVLVSPAYGSDGFALYKKIKPFSAPSY